MGGVVDEALDQVRGLGDAERAAVRDAAGRLVRVPAVRDHVRRRDVVRAGDDVEQPRPELRRLRVGVERALVGEERRAQAGHLAALHRQLAAHVVVAREAGRDQVPGAVLDPLHRTADQERRRGRDDVPGVDRHLVAEAAAEVGADDPDVLLRQARDDREQRPVRVRRLRREVDRRLAGRRVDVGDAAAALERRRVRARIEGVEADDVVGLGEGTVGRVLVAGLPVVDVVGGLPLLLVADQGRIARRGLLRARDRRQRLVVHLDQLERVLRDVRRLGDHARDLLPLVAHLVGDEHGLRVARQRRHPGEVVLRHQLARDDGDDARQRLGGRRVDRAQARVGVRAAQDLHVEHPRQGDVVEVLALPRRKRASSLRLTEWPTPRTSCVADIAYASLMVLAALCTAWTMFW